MDKIASISSSVFVQSAGFSLSGSQMSFFFLGIIVSEVYIYSSLEKDLSRQFVFGYKGIFAFLIFFPEC